MNAQPSPDRGRARTRIALVAGALVLAIAGVGALVASGRLGADPAFRGTGADASLAFVRIRGGRTTIFLLEPDGRATEIVSVEGVVDDLDWSPEGASLLLGVRAAGRAASGVFAVRADGSGLRRIGPGTHPAWSPDGKLIAYAAYDGEVHVMSADGSDDAVLTHVRAAAYPDWSADGRTIAFVGPGPDGDRQGWDVYTTNADGSLIANLTSHPAVDTEPAWSPTGATILFRTNRAVPPEDHPTSERLFVMNAEGSNLVRITDDETTVTRAPTWSPDGTRIAFDDGRSIFVADADGSNVVRVVDGVRPAWRPSVDVLAEPDAEPSASAAHDLGLPFDVCDVTRVAGRFATADGTAYVASRMDGGSCPAMINAPQLVAVDVDGDGLVDATYDSPTCQDWCTIFAAPDVDGDGTSELLVQTAQFTIAGLQLYDVAADPPQIVPVTVRPPGAQAFPAGEPAQFWHGAEGYNIETLGCSGDGRSRLLVSKVAYQNPPDSGPWLVEETRFRLHRAELEIVGTSDAETDEPSLQAERDLVCGAAVLPSPS